MREWVTLSTPAPPLDRVVDLCATPALLPPNHRAPREAITTLWPPAPVSPTPAHALVRHG